MNVSCIHNESEHAAALARIEQLMAAEPGTAEFNELEVLAVLIEAYEREHFPIDLPSPAAAIAFRMEQANLTQADLAAVFGGRSRVSEVLSGKRGPSKIQILKLSEVYGIPSLPLLQSPTGRKSQARSSGALRENTPKQRALKLRIAGSR